MSDVLLNTGDNLILVFPESNDARVDVGKGEIGVPYGRAFFFKVILASNLRYHYDRFANLDPLTGVGYDYLGDGGPPGHGVGNDILRIGEDDWWIYHFGYSPLQDTLRVYRRIQGRANETGFEYAQPNQPDPTLGDVYGYIKGAEVFNWFDPPAETETVSFRNKNEGQMWQFGLYNEHQDLEIDPAILVGGKAYRLDPVIDPKSIERMLKGDPAPFRRRVITVDGMRDWREEAYIPREWKIVGNERYVTWEDITGVPRPGRAVPRATPIVEGRPELQ